MARLEKSFFSVAVILVIGLPFLVKAAFFPADDDVIEAEGRYLAAADTDAARSAIRRASAPHSRPAESRPAPAESRPAAAAPRASARCIAGFVADAAGSPVAGVSVESVLYFPPGEVNYALVSEHVAKAATNEAGLFALDVPGHGFYRVTASHPLFQPVVRERVTAGEVLDLRLEPGGALVGGVLTDEPRRPIAAAKITIRRDKTAWSVSATTDAAGCFEIGGLFAGALYVSIDHPDFVGVSDQVLELAADAPTRKDFVLGRGKRIYGTVADSKRMPVAGAKVSSGPVKATVTDERGEFSFGGFAPDLHQISIVAEGYLTSWQHVNLSGSREEAKIDCVLNAGGTISGDVLDETGKAMRGVEVKVFESYDDGNSYDSSGGWMWDNGNTRYQTTTDDDGRFKVTGVGVRNWGGYRVRARLAGLADAYSPQLQLPADGATVDVHLLLTAGGTISGTVSDDRGAAIAGVKIALNPTAVNEWTNQGRRALAEVMSDAQGRFLFTRLGEQSYHISAFAAGFATQWRGDLKIIGRTVLDNVDLTLERGEPIHGKITNEEQQPIADATVTVQSSKSYGNAVTNAQGEFTLANVGAGPFSATAQAAGYSYERKKDIYPDKGRIDFELKRNGYVWGICIDAETKEPVKGATVELQSATNDRSRGYWRQNAAQVQTDRAGAFKLYAKDGQYKLGIRAKGYVDHVTQNVMVSVSAQPEEMKIELVSGGAAEGWVYDHKGDPLRGAQVYVRDQRDEKAEFTQAGATEGDGYFYVGSLKDGTYDFAFQFNEQIPMCFEGNVIVGSSALPQLRVRAGKPSPLSIIAVGPDDQPLDWLQIHLTSAPGIDFTLSYSRWTDGRAYFRTARQKSYWLDRQTQMRVGDVPPGSYTLVATRDGLTPLRREVVVLNGELNEVVLKLEPPKQNDPGQTDAER
jgi:hypothetical protein